MVGPGNLLQLKALDDIDVIFSSLVWARYEAGRMLDTL